MSDGKHCPACSRDIGVRPLLRTLSLDRVWCPHCRARLAYRDAAWLARVAYAVAVPLAAGALYAVTSVGVPNGPQLVIAYFALLLAFAVPLELAAISYLRRTKTLSRWGAESPP